MAISLIFNTGNAQAAYSRALYTISGSTNVGNPQFQYVCDIYDGSTLIKRSTQTLNPAGSATFDISKIVQGELSIDENWKINSITAFNSSSKSFNLKFGEQYGTSISSSVTVYPDLVLQSNQIFFQGVVEPTAGTYDFVATQQVLSNMPTTMSMQSDDYGTISIYNDQNTFISQSFYSASDSTGGYELVDEQTYSTSGTYFNAVPISSSANYWNYVDVSISSSFGTENYRYEASDETHREKTRFTFVNKLGAWDYYNNYNPVKQTIEVMREQYTSPRVNYSSRTPVYDIERRGLTNFHSSVDDSFTVQTDYLDKENANWLEELIESPEVYIQRNGEFIPIIITNSSYTANTNQARQKLFQYNIDFIPSNQPFGKWIPEYVSCPKKLYDAPDIETLAATNVDHDSLTFNGDLTSLGEGVVDIRGFVYSTSSTNPTIADSVTSESSGPYSTGSYSINSGNIFDGGSSVYFKAFVSSSEDIYYGDVLSAAILSDPSVITNEPVSLTSCSLEFRGNINYTASADITEKGWYYSTSSTNPYIGDDQLKDTTGTSPYPTGNYSASTGCIFSGSTEVYMRAYISSSENEIFTGSVQSGSTLVEGFDPAINGINPQVWFDFVSGDSSMTFIGATDTFDAVDSKGDQSNLTLSRLAGVPLFPPTSTFYTKYNDNWWDAPEWQGEYSTFYRGIDSSNNNYVTGSVLSTYWKDVTYQSGFDFNPPAESGSIVGFNSGSDFTQIVFIKPTFSFGNLGYPLYSQTPQAGVSYKGRKTDDIMQIEVGFNSTGSLQRIASISSSLDGVNNTTSASLAVWTSDGSVENAVYQNYSGSVAPWQSWIFRNTPGDANPVTITQDFTNTYTSTNKPHNGQAVTTVEQLTIGTQANYDYIKGAGFDIAHYLFYTSSLSQAQIENIINSFKESVSYGNTLNS